MQAYFYGGGAVVVAIIVTASLVRFLLGDRGAFEQRDKAIADLRDDVSSLREQVDSLTNDLKAKSSEKHQVDNDLAKTVLALDVVRRLAAECTCDKRPLEPLQEIIERLVAELDSLKNRQRRIGDVARGGA